MYLIFWMCNMRIVLRGQDNYSNELAISFFITLDKMSNEILDN